MMETKRSVVPTAEEVIDAYFPVLDHGFVALKDYMGGDAAIEQAARVSFGEGTRKLSDTRTLLRFLFRNRHCYDAKTEVLTNRGFVPWPQVTMSDRLACWDQERGTLCYEHPREIIAEDYNGTLYAVDHRGIDLRVTSEHRMYVSLESRDFALISVRELGHRANVRYCKVAPYNAHEDCELPVLPPWNDRRALLQLFGFFIGDGHASPDKQPGYLIFGLRKQRKIDYLRGLCERLGWRFTTMPSGSSIVYAPELGRYFRQYCYEDSGSKRIPDFLTRLGCSDSRAIIDGLVNSDGWTVDSRWHFSTSERQVADAAQMISIHAGYATNLRETKPGAFVLSSFDRSAYPVINRRPGHTTYKRYRGKVYCATTRTGILVVRRNGKVCLSGNSSPFEMSEATFHVGAPIMVFRQLFRHRTLNINEMSGRYSIMPLLFYTPSVSEVCKQSTGNKQGRAVPIDDDRYRDYIQTLLAERQLVSRNYRAWLTEDGMAREVARLDLPLSTYSFAYIKCDLRNLFHLLGLRTDSHAQWEIRQFADVMAGIVQRLAPLSFEAWQDYQENAVTFSQDEMQALRLLSDLGPPWTLWDSPTASVRSMVEEAMCEAGCTKREMGEFWNKLRARQKRDYSLDPTTARDGSYYSKLIADHAVEVPV